MRSSSLAPSIDLSSNDQIGAIAQWMRLCLPFCGPWFESQARHLCFFQFIFELWCEKDKNKQKEAGIGPIFENEQIGRLGYELQIATAEP